MPELPIDLIYDRVNHKFKLLPDPEEMAERLTDGSPKQKEVFFQLYNSAMKDFDLKGYNWLLDTGQSILHGKRCTYTFEVIERTKSWTNTPPTGFCKRCRKSTTKTPMLTELVAKVQSAAGTQGRNCFGSVLYPITIPDFLSADVTDSVMEGVIGSATAYLGMYWSATNALNPQPWSPNLKADVCSASIFPRCWQPSDPLYDIPDDLFVPREPVPTPFVEETPPEIPYTPPPKPPVYKPPVHVEKCNCLDLQHLRDVCLYHAAVPVVVRQTQSRKP
ncbi:hypothetical protein ACSSS7_000948 [Eimeria intestinalis]